MPSVEAAGGGAVTKGLSIVTAGVRVLHSLMWTSAVDFSIRASKFQTEVQTKQN